MTANYHLKGWAAPKKLLLLPFSKASKMVARLRCLGECFWFRHLMGDERPQVKVISCDSQREKRRGIDWGEQASFCSFLFCGFFHPAARNLPPPLRTSAFEGSANENRRNVAIKHRPVWCGNCCCCQNVCYRARSQVAKDELCVTTRPELGQPHPKPSLLPVNQRIGGLLCVPVALARGRPVASSQTCPNEYLILTWLPIASVQYGMHNGARCGLARRAHPTSPPHPSWQFTGGAELHLCMGGLWGGWFLSDGVPAPLRLSHLGSRCCQLDSTSLIDPPFSQAS